MKRTLLLTSLASLGLVAPGFSEPAALAAPASAPAPAPASSTGTATDATESGSESADSKMKEEQARLALENSLADERLKKETAEMRAEAARLKAEKELMTERLALAALQRKAEQEVEAARVETEAAKLNREAELAKARAEALAAELKAVEAESRIEITRLKGEIDRIETSDQRQNYASADPVYLEKPLRDDGTIVISDRRIALNGVITSETANHVTDRIHYFNNQNRKLPIFIVIDDSPGGSVMAGYRILKAMDASDAPIHVVVKSFAASMAAAITTLAEESYAYPNAILLHHQISAFLFGRLNLTQQEEFLKESQRWWDRLATPIAAKMGITTGEFIRRMYEHSSSGDWSEFAEQAQELKWVNHIVSGIDETSFLKNPDSKDSGSTATRSALEEGLDENGSPVVYLPRLNPKDVYFLYNPDGYYRLR